MAKRLSTHQVVRISGWIDSIEGRQRVRRCAAIKAAEIGNRNAAIYWSAWCMKAESVLSRLRLRLNMENSLC